MTTNISENFKRKLTLGAELKQPLPKSRWSIKVDIHPILPFKFSVTANLINEEEITQEQLLPERTRSMFYYHIVEDGIHYILSANGDFIMLNEMSSLDSWCRAIIVSAEEWNNLRAGEIPTRLRQPWY